MNDAKPAPKPLPPPSDAKKVKVTCYLDPVLHKALQHECIDRDTTLGELFEEAVRTRPVVTWKR